MVGLYAETNRGSTSYYAQAISVLTVWSTNCVWTIAALLDVKDAFDADATPSASAYVTVRNLFELDEDSNKYKVEGDGAWTGNTSYSVKSGYPDRRRHLRRQRDPLSNGRAYIQDSTFFIGAEAVGDDLDISTATGMMSVDMSSQNTDGSAMKAYAIVDKSNNAVFRDLRR